MPPERLRRETDARLTPPSDRAPGRDIPTTPRLTRVLALAAEEALGFQQPHIDTEHLLLGLLREPEGVAAAVLADLGLTLEATRPQVGRLCGREYQGGLIQATPPAPAAPVPPAAPPRSFRLPDAKARADSFTDDRLRELERTVWEQQIYLGALTGVLAGLGLAALYWPGRPAALGESAFAGLLLGGLTSASGRPWLGAVVWMAVGVLFGPVMGQPPLGTYIGRVFGAMLGFYVGISVVRRPPGRRKHSRWPGL
jgi:hypothetical protein